MKKILSLMILGVMVLALSSSVDAGFAVMSDSSAKAKAVALWGPYAGTAKFWHVGATSNWVFQIGCFDDKNGFLVVSQATGSWDKAFAQLDPSKNGAFRITARARQADSQTATSPVITVTRCNAVIH